MLEDGFHMPGRKDGLSLPIHTGSEDDVDDFYGYSPIARLERRVSIAIHQPAIARERAASMWVTDAEYQDADARLRTGYSRTDLAQALQFRDGSADHRTKRNSCSDADTTHFAEMMAESQGCVGDRYVFVIAVLPIANHLSNV